LAYVYDALIPFEALGSFAHEHARPWWAWASAVLLAGLFVYFVVDDLRRAWLRRGAPAGPAVVTLDVDGLTCNNCVRKLERALRDADGVTSAMVTLDPGRATVEASVSTADLEAVVRAAGYAPK
ncbi:MAG: heavy metal-associated domain-containing protein, partial [Polyangiales bacterium]